MPHSAPDNNHRQLCHPRRRRHHDDDFRRLHRPRTRRLRRLPRRGRKTASGRETVRHSNAYIYVRHHRRTERSNPAPLLLRRRHGNPYRAADDAERQRHLGDIPAAEPYFREGVDILLPRHVDEGVDQHRSARDHRHPASGAPDMHVLRAALLGESLHRRSGEDSVDGMASADNSLARPANAATSTMSAQGAKSPGCSNASTVWPTRACSPPCATP